MAHQNVCKQGRDEMKVKVNIQLPHPYIVLHLAPFSSASIASRLGSQWTQA